MKTRLLLLAAAGLVIAVTLALIASDYWERNQPGFQNAPKLIAALQAFSRDREAHSLQAPAEISLRDLAAGGYVTTNDARAFDGTDVRFFAPQDESNPQLLLACARTPGGAVICLLADGSIQQLTRERYEQYRADQHQGDAARRTQPHP